VPASYDPLVLLKDIEDTHEQEASQTTGYNEAGQASSQTDAHQIEPGGEDGVPEVTPDEVEGGRRESDSIES